VGMLGGCLGVGKSEVMRSKFVMVCSNLNS
jgi:hypothetical protein